MKEAENCDRQFLLLLNILYFSCIFCILEFVCFVIFLSIASKKISFQACKTVEGGFFLRLPSSQALLYKYFSFGFYLLFVHFRPFRFVFAIKSLTIIFVNFFSLSLCTFRFLFIIMPFKFAITVMFAYFFMITLPRFTPISFI